MKQYEDAIKSHQRGREVLYDELPTPPGFAPIPYSVPSTPASPPAALKTPAPKVPVRPVSSNISSHTAVSPSSALDLPPPRSHSSQFAGVGAAEPTSSTATDGSNQLPATGSGHTEQNELLQSVYAKERACKEAALQAKHVGRLDQAKEFLKLAKGYGKVIADYQSGQEVDLSAVSNQILS